MSKKNALHQLFKKHAHQIRGYFRGRTGRKADAEDLAQEIFLRLLRVTDLASIRNPEAYLKTMARNLFGEWVLSRRRDREIELALSQEPQVPFDNDMEQARLVAELRRFLAKRDPKERLVLAMHYQGKSYEEISKAFGWSSPTSAQKAVARALKRITQIMLESEAP